MLDEFIRSTYGHTVPIQLCAIFDDLKTCHTTRVLCDQFAFVFLCFRSAPNLRSLVFRPDSLQSDVGLYLPNVEMVMVCVASVHEFMEYVAHIDQYSVVRSALPDIDDRVDDARSTGESTCSSSSSAPASSVSSDLPSSSSSTTTSSGTTHASHAENSCQPDDTDSTSLVVTQDDDDAKSAVPLSDRYFAHFPSLKKVVLPLFSNDYTVANKMRCRFTSRTHVDIVLQRVDDESRRKVCDRCGLGVTGNYMRQQCSCSEYYA